MLRALRPTLATTGGIVAGSIATQQQDQALQGQEKQQQLATSTQKLQRSNQLLQVLQTATVQGQTRGISTSSPSFNAIIENSENQAFKDQGLADLDSNIRIANLQNEIAGSKEAEAFQAASSLLKLGTSIAGDVETERLQTQAGKDFAAFESQPQNLLSLNSKLTLQNFLDLNKGGI